jgi:hypothetical protein
MNKKYLCSSRQLNSGLSARIFFLIDGSIRISHQQIKPLFISMYFAFSSWRRLHVTGPKAPIYFNRKYSSQFQSVCSNLSDLLGYENVGLVCFENQYIRIIIMALYLYELQEIVSTCSEVIKLGSAFCNPYNPPPHHQPKRSYGYCHELKLDLHTVWRS